MPERSSSGVRNLRAMFENGNDSSSSADGPRGRSPGGSEIVTSPGATTPRPLSKIRTSFVAIERSGAVGAQLGLRKTSDGPGNSGAEGKDKIIEEESNNVVLSPTAVVDETAPKNKSAVVDTANATAGSGPKRPLMGNGSASTVSGEKATSGHSLPTSKDRAAPAEMVLPKTPSKSNTSKLKTAVGESSNPADIPLPPTPATTGRAAPPGKDPKPQSLPLKTSKADNTVSAKTESPRANKAVSRSAPVSTKLANTNKAMSKSSPSTSQAKTTVLPKTPSTPVHSSAAASSTPRKTPLKTNGPGVLKKSSSKQVLQPQAANKPVSSVQAQKTNASSTTTKTSPKASHPVPNKKSRPRSPTRPVPLPASATAPTASSAAKTASDSVPSSRATSRATTHTRNAPQPPNSRAGELRKQPSRHSLPTNGHRKMPERPRSRVSSGTVPVPIPDEGFLARVMRPTTSSASKTHEKLEIRSPPRPTRPAHAKPKRRSDASDSPRSHRYVNDDHSDGMSIKSRHEEPRHEESHHKEPHHKEPHRKEPHHEEPHHEELQHEEPSHEEPQYEEPSHEEPSSPPQEPLEAQPEKTPEESEPIILNALGIPIL